MRQFLVPSDGTRKLGNDTVAFNSTRDQGSKIVYFDTSRGNNDTADVYWWNGTRIVDSNGSSTNPSNGLAYGTDPLAPNETAIRAFRQAIGTAWSGAGDLRLRTHNSLRPGALAAGYPDWYLLRRGQTHDTFDGPFFGGRSEKAPLVVAAYGPLADGRAILAPVEGRSVKYGTRTTTTVNPLSLLPYTSDPVWFHLALVGMEVRVGWSAPGLQDAESKSGGPVTALIEDCRWSEHAKELGNFLLYLAQKTTVRRSILANCWASGPHANTYYTSGSKAQTTFDEVIFYRGGYKSNPVTNPDPKRDIFSRNIYQGGGGLLGHKYLNIISADGGSGGPQMRFGGQIENSLLIEGYWFSGTQSNGPNLPSNAPTMYENKWMRSANQSKQSAIVRNNVQFVLAYPTPKDPDVAGLSDSRAQPGWGYTLSDASFGASVDGNIISTAMLVDELGVSAPSSYAVSLDPGKPQLYDDGITYHMHDNTVRDNIFYRTGIGLSVQNDWTGTARNVVERNVFVVDRALANNAKNLSSNSQLEVRNNRFYTAAAPQGGAPVGVGNAVAAKDSAAKSEGWPDPNRTLRRYVIEVLGLTLLDWSDDPFLVSRDTGTVYDPTGLKTFMAVAMNMRQGGRDAIPRTGKPSLRGDYPYDARFTGKAVVNWIRAGFGLAAVP